VTRTTVTPFLRGRTYWARVPRLGLVGAQRSLGTDDKSVAQAMCSFLQVLRGRRESFLLDALAQGRALIGDAFTAYQENRLDAFIGELREGRRDEDVAPYLEKWQKELARIGKPNAETRAKYLYQVRTFIPEGKPFARSRLTPKGIRAWLAGLDMRATNRYRAALSSFCQYLVSEEVVPFNPVLQVKAAKEAEPRLHYLDQTEARAILDGLTDLPRVLHALAACTALERQALLALKRRDLDLTARTALARATKRAHRARTVSVYDRWSWAWQIVADYVKAHPMLPDAKVFAGLKASTAYFALKAAAKAAGRPEYTTHDWRHTWAVQALRDGLAIQTVSHQLGHRDAVMTLRVYGRFIPTAADFQARNLTLTATAAQESATK
jgi:integrase